MRHHAPQLRAALVQGAADLEQHRVLGLDAGAMAVGVDLDQTSKACAVRAAEGGDRLRRRDAVGDELQVAAARGAAPAPAASLSRRDADRIEDVA